MHQAGTESIMLNEMAELIFIIGGLAVVLLLVLRMRRLSSKERNTAATAAVGLFLCGRYAALIHNDLNWLFVGGVGFMMFLLAYNNLGFDRNPQFKAE